MSRNWRERDHPRDRRGRFADTPGGGWASAVSDALGGHHRAIGQDRRAELDHDDLNARIQKYRDEIQARGNERGVEDTALTEVYHAQGYHGLPEMVSQDEMSRRLAAGWIETYRGFGTEDYAQMFDEGDHHYGGLGIYGNGTYTGAFGEARHYAMDWRPTRRDMTMGEEEAEFDDYRTWEGLRRMAIHPDARIITADELRRIFLDTYGYPDENPGPEGLAMRDPGRLAAALGYDAIYRENSGIDDFWIILNRTAVAVEKR